MFNCLIHILHVPFFVIIYFLDCAAFVWIIVRFCLKSSEIETSSYNPQHDKEDIKRMGGWTTFTKCKEDIRSRCSLKEVTFLFYILDMWINFAPIASLFFLIWYGKQLSFDCWWRLGHFLLWPAMVHPKMAAAAVRSNIFPISIFF